MTVITRGDGHPFVARRFFAITPSDSAGSNFTLASAVYVGTGGNVAIVGSDDIAVTFSNVQSGTILPIECIRVNSTNTSATGLVGLVTD
jgi:hypothetical protein